MGGFNIGVVTPQVWFLTRGPFYGQPKQEVSFYFDHNTSNFVKASNIEALPDPIKGVRLAESLMSYDNFLYSDDGYGYLEENPQQQDKDYIEPTSANDPTTRTQTSQGAASERAAIAVTASGTSGAVSAEQKGFFTWTVSQNIFGDIVGSNFASPEELKFTYARLSRPNGNSKAEVLTPFFTRSAENVADGPNVHWGAKTSSSLPLNQPFEVTYYFNERSFNVPSDGYGGNPIFSGISGGSLGSSAYFAMEFGIGSSEGHYLIMMARDDVPKLYMIKGGNAGFVAKYDNPGILQKVFDDTSKYVSIKIECVMGSFIISSNIFPGPWIVQGLPTKTSDNLTSQEKQACPIKYTHRIGQGALGVYAGNTQAGWCFRPVQYACNKTSSSNSSRGNIFDIWAFGFAFNIDGSSHTGGFNTPMVTFSSVTKGEPSITASLCLRGAGNNVTGKSEGNIMMAETESVSGAESGGKFYGSVDVPRGLDRRIQVSVKTSHAMGTGYNSGLWDSYAQVSMTPSDVSAYGWTIPCGRSPYLWMLTLNSPSKTGNAGIPGINVAGDTLSVSLSYNATSYNEITQTGSLKILNPLVINQVRGGRQCDNNIRDYTQYMNRTIYVKIGCHWEKGYGLSGNNDWLFEGMTVGSDVNIEAGRQIVTFKLADYMNVLDQSKFELSPYYDGMIARFAVADIVSQTGLSQDRMKYNNLGIKVTANPKQEYVIPYLNPLNEPQFKFADGSSFKEAILRLAKYDFKTIYWDRFGDFHYDDGPNILGGGPVPKANRKFYTSPIATNDPSLVVWNSANFGRSVNDVYNVLRVDSIDRNINIRVSANARYLAGIRNPNAVGYLGFRKMLLVRDPALGGLAATKRYVRKFQQKMHVPPWTIRFETFGRYDVKPLDLVSLDNKMARVLNISYDMEAATNRFWMTMEGEWFDEFGGAGSSPLGQNPGPETSGS